MKCPDEKVSEQYMKVYEMSLMYPSCTPNLLQPPVPFTLVYLCDPPVNPVTKIAHFNFGGYIDT